MPKRKRATPQEFEAITKKIKTVKNTISGFTNETDPKVRRLAKDRLRELMEERRSMVSEKTKNIGGKAEATNKVTRKYTLTMDGKKMKESTDEDTYVSDIGPKVRTYKDAIRRKPLKKKKKGS